MSEHSSLQSGLAGSIWAEGHQGRNRHASQPSFTGTPSQARVDVPARKPAARRQPTYSIEPRGRNVDVEQKLVFPMVSPQNRMTSKQVISSNVQSELAGLDQAIKPAGPQTRTTMGIGATVPKVAPNTAKKQIAEAARPPGRAPPYPAEHESPAPAAGRETKMPTPERPRKIPMQHKDSPRMDPRDMAKYNQLAHLFADENDPEAEIETEEDRIRWKKAEEEAMNAQWYAPTTRCMIKPPTPDSIPVEREIVELSPRSRRNAEVPNINGEISKPIYQPAKEKIPQHIRRGPSGGPPKLNQHELAVENTRPEWVTKSPETFKETRPPHFREVASPSNTSSPNRDETKIRKIPIDPSIPQSQLQKILPPHLLEQGREVPFMLPKNGRQPQAAIRSQQSMLKDSKNKEALPSYLRDLSSLAPSPEIKSEAEKVEKAIENAAATRPQSKEDLPPHLRGASLWSRSANSEHEVNSTAEPMENLKPIQQEGIKEVKATAPQTKPKMGFALVPVTTIYGDDIPEIPKSGFTKIVTIHEQPPMSKEEFLAKANFLIQKAKQAHNLKTDSKQLDMHKEASRSRSQGPHLDDRPGLAKSIRDMQRENSGQATSALQAAKAKQPEIAAVKTMAPPAKPVQPKQDESKDEPSEHPLQRTMIEFFARGHKKHQKLIQQDPRATSRSPAHVWAKGLIGENRAPDSDKSPSTLYHFDGESEAGSYKSKPPAAQRPHAPQSAHRNSFLGDHAITAQMQAQSDQGLFVDEANQIQIAKALSMSPSEAQRAQHGGLSSSGVDKPSQEPSSEAMGFWSKEPGGTHNTEPEQVTCNICASNGITNTTNYKTFDGLQDHKVRRHNYCVICDCDFQRRSDLAEHKQQTEGHYFCSPCNLDFVVKESLEDHKKQAHPSDEATIPCKRCGKMFVTGAALLSHFEKGHCRNLTPDQYIRARYLMSHYHSKGLAIEGDPRDADKKREQLVQLSKMILGEEKLREEFSRRGNPLLNPWDKRFDASPLIAPGGKYTCPYAGCTYSSDKKGGIVFHLQNGHFRHLSCPSCYEKWATPSALMAHMEKENRRCRFSISGLYEDAVRALSGGYLRAEGYNPDGTHCIIAADPPNEAEMARRIKEIDRLERGE